MKSILRRCSSAIAIVAASLVLFTATIAVAFDKPLPSDQGTAILMANYFTPVVKQTILHRDANGTTLKSLISDTSLTSKSAEKVYGQVPEVTARTGPAKAVAPTLEVDNHTARKVAEATPGHTTWTPVPAKEPLEVSRSGSFNC